MLTAVSQQNRLRFGEYAPSIDHLRKSGVLQHHTDDGRSDSDGYRFLYVATSDKFQIYGCPEEAGVTGDRAFYSDDTGCPPRVTGRLRYAFESAARNGHRRTCFQGRSLIES